jgi:hypothetical protein
MKSKVSQRVKALLRKITNQEKGAALIASLLVLMVLVLLGLTLILQSQTEYLGAVNENDALTTLSFAESGLEWSERVIKDKASGDLDPVLRGPDNIDDSGGNDDGIIGIRNLSTTLTSLSQLNSTCPSSTCEQTESVLITFDWDNDGVAEKYEAFRTGTDLNDDGIWDGPRAHMYMRIEDNYDDPANSGLQDQDDNDFRARVRVKSEYPIFVDSSGFAQDPVLATRGIATRRLEGRLAPRQGVAMITNVRLDAEGTIKVCGACGSIHSNGDMNFSGGAGQVCKDATASDDYNFTGPGPTVGGDSGGNKDVRPIPPINPYDDIFVPLASTFDHSIDAELNFTEPGLGTALQCPPPSAADPGSSKYFAFVFRQTGGQNLQVYKAYWDFNLTAGSRWMWRLIDVGPTLNAVLDNCGRLVSSVDLGLTADPCPAGAKSCDGSGLATYGVNDVVDCCGSEWPVADGGDGNTYCDPNCIDPGLDGLMDTADDINRCRPDGNITAACDGTTSGDEHFYGFKGNNSYTPDTCSTDDSLTGVGHNDFTTNNFFLYPSGNDSDSTVPPLPGSGPPDGQADFDYSIVTDSNRQQWQADGTTIFSPMYNAIIFVVGNMSFTGEMENGFIQFFDDVVLSPTVQGTYSVANPMGRWRISTVSYGRIDANGTPRFGPANSSVGGCMNGTREQACNLGFAAGRDLELRGGAGSGCDVETPPESCNLCPNIGSDPDADCEQSNVVPFGYEGYFVAHEQVSLRGNANFAGFVIAEEAANCVEPQGQGVATNLNGNPDIFYDCESPPNPWEAELLRITSWEEVQ